MVSNKIPEMPSKSLDLKHQNSSSVELKSRINISSIKTNLKNNASNNFLLSPGALQRSESTLSMSLIKYSKPIKSLSSGPCEKIKEEEHGAHKGWT